MADVTNQFFVIHKHWQAKGRQTRHSRRRKFYQPREFEEALSTAQKFAQ